MPVILKPEDEDLWADNSRFTPTVLSLLKPYESSEVEAYLVFPAVNNPRLNSPDLTVSLLM